MKLKINGMKCDGCVKRVENVLKDIKGLKKFEVNLEKGEVSLEGASPEIVELVKDKIETLGFTVSP